MPGHMLKKLLMAFFVQSWQPCQKVSDSFNLYCISMHSYDKISNKQYANDNTREQPKHPA